MREEVILVSVLDLQGMHVSPTRGGKPGGSRASKGCGNASGYSLLLC